MGLGRRRVLEAILEARLGSERRLPGIEGLAQHEADLWRPTKPVATLERALARLG